MQNSILVERDHAPGKLAIECLEWPPLERNKLRGFATLCVPALRLTIKDITVHRKNDRVWIGLPAKAQLDKDGAGVRNGAGKIKYISILEWDSRSVSAAFSARALDAIREFGGES